VPATRRPAPISRWVHWCVLASRAYAPICRHRPLVEGDPADLSAAQLKKLGAPPPARDAAGGAGRIGNAMQTVLGLVARAHALGLFSLSSARNWRGSRIWMQPPSVRAMPMSTDSNLSLAERDAAAVAGIEKLRFGPFCDPQWRGQLPDIGRWASA